jgi:hypothetical protein
MSVVSMPAENMLVVVGHMKHLQQMEEQLLADRHMNSKSKNTVLGPPAGHPNIPQTRHEPSQH